MISLHHPDTATALGDLTTFRQAFYQCLTTRAGALFELTDAALCAEGPITSLVELSLASEHRRGHGSLYDGVNHGRIQTRTTSHPGSTSCSGPLRGTRTRTHRCSTAN